jgi:hypothetical protein
MGTILALISIFLSAILYPFGLLFSFIKYFFKRKFITGLKNFDNQMLDIATSIDANGNVVCEDLFNLCLIKKDGYLFGNRKETVSSALGKNQVKNTLTIVGWVLVYFLWFIDFPYWRKGGHCINSIDELV